MVESSHPRNNGITIWLEKPQFTTDEPVEGSVMLDIGSVPATGLTLLLKGVDELSIWKKHLKKNRRYYKKEEKVTQFAKVKLTLKNFEEKRTPEGKTCYPFRINLPADLPPSVFAKSCKVMSL